MCDDAKDLAEILPLQEIKAYFSKDVTREELRKADLSMIMQQCSSHMFSLAVNCAIRAKQIYKPDLDMARLVPEIESSDPKLMTTLTNLLQEDSLDDIYCCRCTVDNQLVATLLIAQVWPRDLYVGMVMFADPSKPIPSHQRKSVLQRFQGLGLLSTFLKRVEGCAEARGCQNITLIANETSQMNLFAEYGYVVDDYPGIAERVKVGQSIPMHKPLA